MGMIKSSNLDSYSHVMQIGKHRVEGIAIFKQREADEIDVKLLLGIDDYTFYIKAIEFTLENENLGNAGRSLLAEKLCETYSMILASELINLKTELAIQKKPEVRATIHLKKVGDEIIDTIYAIMKKHAPYLKIKQQGGKGNGKKN